MSLRDQGRVVLEVGLNELATRSQNPHVPYGPDEVATDIAACVSHGATLVHFHARYDDGEQGWTDAELSRRALDAAADRADVIAYPSYAAGDLGHVLELADRPGRHRLGVAPFDPPQHLTGAVVAGVSPERPPALDELSRRGLVPNIGVFSLDDLQWTVAAARAGYLRPPVSIKLFLSDRYTRMNRTDLATLDRLVSHLPRDLDHETVVVPYCVDQRATAEALLGRALQLGLGIRVGIGDNPDAWPTQTNAELVDWGRALCAEHGVGAAAPAAFRARFGIDARADRAGAHRTGGST